MASAPPSTLARRWRPATAAVTAAVPEPPPIARERHRRLAMALPSPRAGPVVDLGCGSGETLLALRERFGPELELVGVERDMPALDERLAADARVRPVAADLRAALPFATGSVAAAVCHNTLECLPDKQAFLHEVARVLVAGGHLLLGHSDFDTIAFNASDRDLTRRLVHAFADTQEAWMDAADGMIGRKLVAIGRGSPFELVRTLGWVCIDTQPGGGGLADSAIAGIAGALRRDGHDELVERFDGWLDDLRALAARGEFFFSVNDYAVLLRSPGAP
jgi:SAM-dependent methyltransferase